MSWKSLVVQYVAAAGGPPGARMIPLQRVMALAPSTEPSRIPGPLRFGEFDLDVSAGELLRNGHRLKLQPQPFKLLVLLTSHPGRVVSRDEIRRELWPDGTFVDFDQAVNFSIKQIRDVLRDAADRPLYIETIPRRGYRFIAPINVGPASTKKPFNPDGSTTLRLEKALWTNITELRLAEARRHRYTVGALVLLAVLSLGFALFVLASR